VGEAQINLAKEISRTFEVNTDNTG
jgi:hypothetical protein